MTLFIFDLKLSPATLLFKEKNMYAISLSRCEYEPNSVLEPLSARCPTYAFPAGGIKHIYGVI